jgi:hypothetical protein
VPWGNAQPPLSICIQQWGKCGGRRGYHIVGMKQVLGSLTHWATTSLASQCLFRELGEGDMGSSRQTYSLYSRHTSLGPEAELPNVVRSILGWGVGKRWHKELWEMPIICASSEGRRYGVLHICSFSVFWWRSHSCWNANTNAIHQGFPGCVDIMSSKQEAHTLTA